MSIVGEERTFGKKVGFFTGKVIAINPDAEECKELLGFEVDEDSNSLDYLGISDDNNVKLRVDVWFEDVDSGSKYKAVFYLEDKERTNKDGTKNQYINNVGAFTWCDSEKSLPAWFTGEGSRSYRIANVGEEDLYNFAKKWMKKLSTQSKNAEFDLEWKKLMKGSVKILREQIDGPWVSNLLVLATVRLKEKDGDVKEYQTIYNKDFLYPEAAKFFRNVDYKKSEEVAKIKAKKPANQQAYEKFVLKMMDDQYGCKDVFILGDIKPYDASMAIVTTSSVQSSEDNSY